MSLDLIGRFCIRPISASTRSLHEEASACKFIKLSSQIDSAYQAISTSSILDFLYIVSSLRLFTTKTDQKYRKSKFLK